MRVFTVIVTSGWQGDGWYYVAEFDTRKQAEAKAIEVSRTDAKQRGYIVAVVGDSRTCDKHTACLIVDTSRVKQGPRSRNQHIQYEEAR